MAITANDTGNLREVNDNEIQELLNLLETSSYEGKQKELCKLSIALFCNTRDDYDKAKANLLANQIGFDSAVNPGQKEINAHLRRLVKHPNK